MHSTYYQELINISNNIKISQFIPEVDSPIYHYTGPDAFTSILSKTELRFTNRDYLNDFSEGKYVLNLCIDNSNYICADYHSIEYARLLQTICSEVDVLMKEYCHILSPEKKEIKVENINDYARFILGKDKNFSNNSIYLKKYAHNLKLVPFANWEAEKSPEWWKCYNNVKHRRNHEMKDANQKNVLYSLAGLYLLEIKVAIQIRMSDSTLQEWEPPTDELSSLFYSKMEW